MTKPKAESALVQAWISKPLYAWIKNEAKKRGLTVSAWLRTTLIEMKGSK
jgi:uncharacterized lipoprotein YddW (UPF0748 family)